MKTFINKHHLSSLVSYQFGLFIISGVICYLISIAILLFLVEGFRVEVNFANIIASIIAIYAAYILNKHFIFEKGKHAPGRELAMFYVFSVVGLFMNVLMMYFMTRYTTISYVIIKTIATFFVAIFNFFTRKMFVFKG